MLHPLLQGCVKTNCLLLWSPFLGVPLTSESKHFANVAVSESLQG